MIEDGHIVTMEDR